MWLTVKMASKSVATGPTGEWLWGMVGCRRAPCGQALKVAQHTQPNKRNKEGSGIPVSVPVLFFCSSSVFDSIETISSLARLLLVHCHSTFHFSKDFLVNSSRLIPLKLQIKISSNRASPAYRRLWTMSVQLRPVTTVFLCASLLVNALFLCALRAKVRCRQFSDRTAADSSPIQHTRCFISKPDTPD